MNDLKQKILSEMMITKIESLEQEIWLEIGYRFDNFKEFHNAFYEAYNKVKGKDHFCENKHDALSVLCYECSTELEVKE